MQVCWKPCVEPLKVKLMDGTVKTIMVSSGAASVEPKPPRELAYVASRCASLCLLRFVFGLPSHNLSLSLSILWVSLCLSVRTRR